MTWPKYSTNPQLRGLWESYFNMKSEAPDMSSDFFFFFTKLGQTKLGSLGVFASKYAAFTTKYFVSLKIDKLLLNWHQFLF